jgi:hypothetical protein
MKELHEEDGRREKGNAMQYPSIEAICKASGARGFYSNSGGLVGVRCGRVVRWYTWRAIAPHDFSYMQTGSTRTPGRGAIYCKIVKTAAFGEGGK